MDAREDTADSNICGYTWWLQAQSACEGPAPVKRRPMDFKVQTGVKMQRCISNADRNTTGNVSHFSKERFCRTDSDRLVVAVQALADGKAGVLELHFQ